MAKKSRKKSTARKQAAGGTRGATLRSASISELTQEMQRRARDIDKLEERRAKIMAEVDQLDAELDQLRSALGRTSAPTRGRPRKSQSGRKPAPGRRPKNTRKLPEVLQEVMAGKTMGVAEAAEAAKAAGYKSSSDNFKNIVNQALITDKRFKRVGRGQYTAS